MHTLSTYSRIFVAGIDTDAGKTFVSGLLVNGLEAEYWKPVQTGTDDPNGTDSDWISANTPQGTVIHPESYRYRIPQSPHWAAKHEGERIDPATIQIPDHDRQLIIEGAGGLMVPMNDEALYIDWVAEQQLAVVLVVKLYLGCINHSLLSLEALRSRGIKCLGVIFNGDEQPEVMEAITELGQTQQLGHIPHSENADLRQLFETHIAG